MSKDTISVASEHSLVLFPDSTDMSHASLMVTHSLLNDLKCIESTLCSNYCPFKDAAIHRPL